MQYKNIINTIIAVCGTAITGLIGGWDSVINILAILIALDYITGLMKGYGNKELASDVGFRGIMRKAAIFIVVILANMVDQAIPQQTPIFRTMVCYFYIANEGISISENIVILGVPLPRGLVKALHKIKDDNDEEAGA